MFQPPDANATERTIEDLPCVWLTTPPPVGSLAHVSTSGKPPGSNPDPQSPRRTRLQLGRRSCVSRRTLGFSSRRPTEIESQSHRKGDIQMGHMGGSSQAVFSPNKGSPPSCETSECSPPPGRTCQDPLKQRTMTTKHCTPESYTSTNCHMMHRKAGPGIHQEVRPRLQRCLGGDGPAQCIGYRSIGVYRAAWCSVAKLCVNQC